MKKKIALLCSLVFSLYTFPVSALDTSTENISLSEFPQAITQQMIDQNGLVKRLSGFDNELNAIGYENADATVFAAYPNSNFGNMNQRHFLGDTSMRIHF